MGPRLFACPTTEAQRVLDKAQIPQLFPDAVQLRVGPSHLLIRLRLGFPQFTNLFIRPGLGLPQLAIPANIS
jgi:hypothetical protein